MAYLCEAVAWAGLGARHDADATAMRERVSCRSRNSCARRRPPRRSRRVPGLVEPLRYARSGALVMCVRVPCSGEPAHSRSQRHCTSEAPQSRRRAPERAPRDWGLAERPVTARRAAQARRSHLDPWSRRRAPWAPLSRPGPRGASLCLARRRRAGAGEIHAHARCVRTQTEVRCVMQGVCVHSRRGREAQRLQHDRWRPKASAGGDQSAAVRSQRIQR